MSDTSRRPRFRGALIVALLAVVIVAVVVVGLVTAGTPAGRATTPPPAAATTSPAIPSASTSTSATPSATASASAKPAPSTVQSPQPTRSAAIASSAPITKTVTAKVTRTEAVAGTAKGPGEIAGPAVRFRVVITNATGRSLDLSNTVVNAYYGSKSTPADPLEQPGGRPFPASAAAGTSATGIFVFSIPKADRTKVQITVDTSTRNPVIAFTGRVP